MTLPLTSQSDGISARSESPEPNPQEKELALRRYDSVLRYLGTETQIYWTRSQLFLVANTALLGFELNGIRDEAPTERLIALLFGAFIGVWLCFLWRSGLDSGEGWMEHWKTALRQWEELAFGDVNLYRIRPADVPKPTRRVARKTLWLFLMVWLLVAAYLILLLVLRLAHYPPLP